MRPLKTGCTSGFGAPPPPAGGLIVGGPEIVPVKLYTFRRFGPPQSVDELPWQTILHPLSVAGAPVPLIAVPQKHCVANSRPASGKLSAWHASTHAGTVMSPLTPTPVGSVRLLTSSLIQDKDVSICCFLVLKV